MMTDKEIFDRVATHLLLQGKRACVTTHPTGHMTCAYRGDGGTSCAVGCLITDEAYDPALEGYSVRSTLVREALEKSGVETEFSSARVRLLRLLQCIHDFSEQREPSETHLSYIQRRLRDVADEFGLKG